MNMLLFNGKPVCVPEAIFLFFEFFFNGKHIWRTGYFESEDGGILFLQYGNILWKQPYCRFLPVAPTQRREHEVVKEGRISKIIQCAFALPLTMTWDQ